MVRTHCIKRRHLQVFKASCYASHSCTIALMARLMSKLVIQLTTLRFKSLGSLSNFFVFNKNMHEIGFNSQCSKWTGQSLSELEIILFIWTMNVFFKLCFHKKKKKNTFCSNYSLADLWQIFGILVVNFSR